MNITGPNTAEVVLTNITGNGTLGITVASNTAVDKAGNQATGDGPSSTFVVDSIKPVISIAAPSTNKTARGPVSFLVTASDGTSPADDNLVKPFTLTAAEVALSTTPGAINGTIRFVQVSPTSVRVIVENINGGKGTLRLEILTGAATDKATNGSDPVTSAPVNVLGVKRLVVGIVKPPLRALPGATVAYKLYYKNAGNQIDKGAALIAYLPNNATFNAAKSLAGWVHEGAAVIDWSSAT